MIAARSIADVLGPRRTDSPVPGAFQLVFIETQLYTCTGLTFGTISALYGFSHGIISQAQYSYLVAVVIMSAVVPTYMAGLAFLPRHLLPKPVPREGMAPRESGPSAEG